MSDHNEKSTPAAPAGPTPPLLSKPAWVRCIPFLVYLSFLAVVELLGRLGFSDAELRWMYAVKIAAVCVTLVMFWRHYTELHTWQVSPIWTAIAVLVGVLVFVVWINLSSGWMLIGSPTGFDPRTMGQINWPMVAVRIAGAALVVPIMEELFWRSFLLRWLDATDFQSVLPAAVRLQSVVIASLLFGFEHNQWFAGILAGLAYSVLYMRQGSLWSAILAHAVTNGILGVWVVHNSQWAYW